MTNLKTVLKDDETSKKVQDNNGQIKDIDQIQEYSRKDQIFFDIQVKVREEIIKLERKIDDYQADLLSKLQKISRHMSMERLDSTAQTNILTYMNRKAEQKPGWGYGCT